MTAHVKHNSGNNEWYTPPRIIEAVREVFYGGIDLDPASCPVANRTVGATTFFTLDGEEDALTTAWEPYGRIFVNPPYGRGLFSKFVQKILAEAAKGAQMIVLVNNGTETRDGQALLRIADAVCFLAGRVRFLDETGTPKYTPLQGQMMLAINVDPVQFTRVFGYLGVVR